MHGQTGRELHGGVLRRAVRVRHESSVRGCDGAIRALNLVVELLPDVSTCTGLRVLAQME